MIGNLGNSFSGMFEDGDKDIFKTDVKTIIGKNTVLNFLGLIRFEIDTISFSQTANDIARFYEEAKNTGFAMSFFENPVMKMILEEIEYMPTVKKYLNERFFNYIKEEERERYENLFKNNDKIREENRKKEQEFQKKQLEHKKQIKKIMQQYDVNEKKAEQIYQQRELEKVKTEMQKELEKTFNDFISKGFLQKDVSVKLSSVKNKNQINNSNSIAIDKNNIENQSIDSDNDVENIEIELDCNKNNDDNSNGFWI